MRVHWICLILNVFDNINSVDSLADSRDMRQQIKLQIIMGPMNTCIDGV